MQLKMLINKQSPIKARFAVICFSRRFYNQQSRLKLQFCIRHDEKIKEDLGLYRHKKHKLVNEIEQMYFPPKSTTEKFHWRVLPIIRHEDIRVQFPNSDHLGDGELKKDNALDKDPHALPQHSFQPNPSSSNELLLDDHLITKCEVKTDSRIKFKCSVTKFKSLYDKFSEIPKQFFRFKKLIKTFIEWGKKLKEFISGSPPTSFLESKRDSKKLNFASRFENYLKFPISFIKTIFPLKNHFTSTTRVIHKGDLVTKPQLVSSETYKECNQIQKIQMQANWYSFSLFQSSIETLFNLIQSVNAAIRNSSVCVLYFCKHALGIFIRRKNIDLLESPQKNPSSNVSNYLLNKSYNTSSSESQVFESNLSQKLKMKNEVPLSLPIAYSIATQSEINLKDSSVIVPYLCEQSINYNSQKQIVESLQKDLNKTKLSDSSFIKQNKLDDFFVGNSRKDIKDSMKTKVKSFSQNIVHENKSLMSLDTDGSKVNKLNPNYEKQNLNKEEYILCWDPKDKGDSLKNEVQPLQIDQLEKASEYCDVQKSLDNGVLSTYTYSSAPLKTVIKNEQIKPSEKDRYDYNGLSLNSSLFENKPFVDFPQISKYEPKILANIFEKSNDSTPIQGSDLDKTSFYSKESTKKKKDLCQKEISISSFCFDKDDDSVSSNLENKIEDTTYFNFPQLSGQKKQIEELKMIKEMLKKLETAINSNDAVKLETESLQVAQKFLMDQGNTVTFQASSFVNGTENNTKSFQLILCLISGLSFACGFFYIDIGDLFGCFRE